MPSKNRAMSKRKIRRTSKTMPLALSRFRRFRQVSAMRSNLRGSMLGLHHFKRATGVVTIPGSSLTPTYLNAFTFQMTSVIQASDFSNLFDQYRLNRVVLSFRIFQSPDAQSAATSNYPILYYVKDYDDSGAPGSLSVIQEYATYKKRILKPNSWVRISLTPAILQQLFQTTVSTAYSPKWKQWIDWTNASAQHFGLKIGVTDLTANYTMVIDTDYYFSCRKVR